MIKRQPRRQENGSPFRPYNYILSSCMNQFLLYIPKPDVIHKKQAILLPSVHNIYVSYARDLLKVAGK